MSCLYTEHAMAGTVWTSTQVLRVLRQHESPDSRFILFASENAPDAGQDSWHATTVLEWLGY